MGKFNFEVTAAEEGKALKVLLRERFGFSGKMMSKIKHGNLLSLNGEKTPGWVPAKAGDKVEVELPEEASDFPAQDIPINVVYEDEDLLVINKQPGVVVHPTMGQPDHTMANGVMTHMAKTGQSFKIRFVNRLDRDTSGLLLVAKNAYVQDELSKQMKQGKVSKIYNALVCDLLFNDGKIDVPIGRRDPLKVERGPLAEEEGGFPSVTHYHILERYPFGAVKLSNSVTSGLGDNGENLGIDREDLRTVYAGIDSEKMESMLKSRRAEYCEGITLCEIRLETGRTHQIRVHMGSIGHHVVGDTLYGGVLGRMDEEKGHFVPLIERQALHARFLSFVHPITKEAVTFEAPLPADFLKLKEKIENESWAVWRKVGTLSAR